MLSQYYWSKTVANPGVMGGGYVNLFLLPTNERDPGGLTLGTREGLNGGWGGGLSRGWFAPRFSIENCMEIKEFEPDGVARRMPPTPFNLYYP